MYTLPLKSVLTCARLPAFPTRRCRVFHVCARGTRLWSVGRGGGVVRAVLGPGVSLWPLEQQGWSPKPRLREVGRQRWGGPGRQGEGRGTLPSEFTCARGNGHTHPPPQCRQGLFWPGILATPGAFLKPFPGQQMLSPLLTATLDHEHAKGVPFLKRWHQRGPLSPVKSREGPWRVREREKSFKNCHIFQERGRPRAKP